MTRRVKWWKLLSVVFIYCRSMGLQDRVSGIHVARALNYD